MRPLHLRLLPALVAILAAGCGQPKEKPSDAVAKIGGQIITRADLDKDIAGQLQQMEDQYQQQAYQLRKQTLEKLINEKLFAPKAKEAGLASGEAYFEKVWKETIAKQPEPSEAELQAQYEGAKASNPGIPPYDQVRPRIVDYLKSQKAQPEMRKLYDDLKKESKIKVLLLPPMPPRKDVAAEGPSKGDAGAPITIVEFSDFQCPYCVRAEETVKELLAAYPGKIRLVYRDYPLEFHKLAPKAAEASHCAGDQGKYWEMHGKLFEANGALEIDSLKKLAREVGLDEAKFDQCLDSGAKKAVVDANFAAGSKLGVTGTPAFFVNGRLISGALPLDDFKAVVDAELER